MAVFQKRNIPLYEINFWAKEPKAFIAACDRRYESALAAIVADALETLGQKNVFMLAGPSASGKTTTAHKLAAAFGRRSVEARVISLDDFYRGRGFCPKREDGTEDYETVHSLDLDCFTACMEKLLAEGEAEFPIFDFQVKQRAEETRHISLGKDQALIIEGIHGLNPLLTRGIEGRVKRVYATAMDRFVGDDVVLKTNDLRFCRRIVRDCRHRNVSGAETVDIWPYVCDGEFIYIKPYRSECDYYVNTAFGYEPGIYAGYLRAILEGMGDIPQTGKVGHILRKLQRFVPIDPALVSKDAMVQEFIG
ncbi:hypothetical protein KQI11_08045 [Acetanaerobacterium sp. MSJ-12]|uniref:uridine kinase family protein n=1 Tax=Acetanaerobacterium sp. MSJ-12 TaxID=2841535 RepID=UPI001C0EDB7D|nr:hypothetical protein [Acetanaerobacterium sp. MSJ-12]MBU5420070.1 hypothetical protein [Acetanaerobacterium sp. MSJ-12]